MKASTARQIGNATAAALDKATPATWLVRFKHKVDQAWAKSNLMTYREAKAYARALRESGAFAEAEREKQKDPEMTNTFIPASMSWDHRVPTSYRPVLYQVDTTKLRLALHFDIGQRDLPESLREWVVSDPISGRCICRVLATFKGCPVSSRGLGPRDARVAAVATLDALVDRVGADRLLEKLRASWEAAE